MIEIIGFWNAILGCWLFCDGIFSLNVYLNAPSQWRKDNPDSKQTWFRDHWIRAIRIIVGIVLMYLGYILLGLN